MREAEELLGVLFQFYKPWQMARLLSCKQRRVSNIWDNHSRILGVNLYGLFASWEYKKWTYSGSIKEAASAKFILRQIKILFTLRPWCLVAKKTTTTKKEKHKKTAFHTREQHHTCTRQQKNLQKGPRHRARERKKQLLCRRVVTHVCPPPPLPPHFFLPHRRRFYFRLKCSPAKSVFQADRWFNEHSDI